MLRDTSASALPQQLLDDDQYFDYKNCEIRHFDDKETCDCGQFFDTQAGECRCTERPCPVGFYFNTATAVCDCKCLTQWCPTNYEWDDETCSCVCAKQVCANVDVTDYDSETTVSVARYFDADTCSCQFEKRSSAANEYWNPTTGTIECKPQDCTTGPNQATKP